MQAENTLWIRFFWGTELWDKLYRHKFWELSSILQLYFNRDSWFFKFSPFSNPSPILFLRTLRIFIVSSSKKWLLSFICMNICLFMSNQEMSFHKGIDRIKDELGKNNWRVPIKSSEHSTEDGTLQKEEGNIYMTHSIWHVMLWLPV